jgi:acyl-CoA thioesterase-2
MSDLWTDLVSCLDLRTTVPAGDSVVFEGANLPLTYHRLFGGQLLAQFVRAAGLTCADKAVKSVHTVFPREGGSAEPVRYEVTRHHEGRSIATLSIIARQAKGVIATASVSMHTGEDGLDQQTVPPVPAVPDPDNEVTIGLLPFDIRTTTDLDDRAAAAPEFELWWRTPPVEAALAPALAAYATDLTLIGTALRAVDGVSQQDAGTAFTSAVTAHTLWFHRPFRTDEWLLLRQHSPLLAHGRGFGRGDVLTENGVLVASYAQEALVRFTGEV